MTRRQSDISEARTIGDLPERFNVAAWLLDQNLMRDPDKVAIIDEYGECTYATLADQCRRMGVALSSQGLAAGDRVLLCLTDTRYFPIAFLGAIRAGLVPVPVNTLLTTDDYAWILKDSDASAVIVSGELADSWKPIADATENVVFLSSGGGPWEDLADLLEQSHCDSLAANTRREDVAFWLYTSGSTGRPKGAMHRHASMLLTASLYSRRTLGMGKDDLVLSIAKQFFAYGLGNSLTFPFFAGATVLLHSGRATPEAINSLIEKYPVSILCGVPTFFAGWLADPSCPTKETARNLRLATSAGEALPDHIAMEFRDRFGAYILDGLGSTEMLHIFVSQRQGDVRFGCTGRPVDGYDVRIVDEAGSDVGEGEVGNLLIRGPTAAEGYWRNPEKTAATFLNDWTVTGDKYSTDAEGWLTYAGRTDDMLKVGGIYVSPIEVEQVLSGHPDVLEAAVVGAPDSEKLIKPHAYVVVTEGATPDDQLSASLQRFVKSKLAPYKYPRWITFVDELPKTATGKIQRFRLREHA